MGFGFLGFFDFFLTTFFKKKKNFFSSVVFFQIFPSFRVSKIILHCKSINLRCNFLFYSLFFRVFTEWRHLISECLVFFSWIQKSFKRATSGDSGPLGVNLNFFAPLGNLMGFGFLGFFDFFLTTFFKKKKNFFSSVVFFQIFPSFRVSKIILHCKSINLRCNFLFYSLFFRVFTEWRHLISECLFFLKYNPHLCVGLFFSFLLRNSSC